MELDPSGRSGELTLDEDGKRHGTVTASWGTACLTGDLDGKPFAGEIPMGADDVFDCFGAVTPLSVAAQRPLTDGLATLPPYRVVDFDLPNR